MTDLIQRLTDATVNERGLFEEAFVAIHPWPAKLGMANSLYEVFYRMLDAEAWTSAAEMLVPFYETEDGPKQMDHIVGQTNGGLTCHAEVGGRGDDFMEFGATKALALLIAALKAHGSKETGHD